MDSSGALIRPGAATARRRRRARLIVLLLVVALLIAGAVAGVVVFQNAARAAEARGEAAAAAVQRYLESVAAGDADAALSQVNDAPAAGGLLTKQALAAALTSAPMTDVATTANPLWGSTGQISASYRLGGTAVTASYDVVDPDGSGTYLLAAPSQLSLGPRFQGLAMTVNGVAVTGSQVAVFPGTYTLGVTTSDYTIAGGAPFAVGGTEPTDVPASVAPALDDAGVKVYREAVAASVQTCISSRKLASGCGLDLSATLSDGTKLYDDTVYRVLPTDTQAALASVVPTLDPNNPAIAVSGDIGPVTAAANCTQGGTNGQCDVRDAPILTGAAVNMLQSPPGVNWR